MQNKLQNNVFSASSGKPDNYVDNYQIMDESTDINGTLESIESKIETN